MYLVLHTFLSISFLMCSAFRKFIPLKELKAQLGDDDSKLPDVQFATRSIQHDDESIAVGMETRR